MSPARMTRLMMLLAATIVMTGCIGTISGDDLDAEIRERSAGKAQETLAEALPALRKELNEDDPEFSRIVIGPPTATFRLPKKGGGYEDRLFTGASQTRVSDVPADAVSESERDLFRASDVPALDRLSELEDRAVEATKMPGGLAAELHVGRTTDGVRITVAVRFDAGTLYVSFAADGTDEQVER